MNLAESAPVRRSGRCWSLGNRRRTPATVSWSWSRAWQSTKPAPNPNETLAEVFPGLSATGRRRSDSHRAATTPRCLRWATRSPNCPTRSSEPARRGGTDRVANWGDFGFAIAAAAPTTQPTPTPSRPRRSRFSQPVLPHPGQHRTRSTPFQVLTCRPDPTRLPPVRPTIGSLRALGRHVRELRESGQDRAWLRSLIDLVQDRAAVHDDAVQNGLDDLRAGRVQPAQRFDGRAARLSTEVPNGTCSITHQGSRVHQGEGPLRGPDVRAPAGRARRACGG